MFAQTSIGAHGGMNYSFDYYDYPNSEGNLSGPSGTSFGILYESDITNFLYLQAEFNFIPRSQIETNSNLITTGTITSTSTYLELPLLLKWKFKDISRIGTPFVYVGLTPALYLDGSQADWTSSKPVELSKFYDFLFNLGAGYEIKLNRIISIYFDARYFQGLINKLNPEAPWIKPYRQTTRDFNIGLGVKICLTCPSEYKEIEKAIEYREKENIVYRQTDNIDIIGKIRDIKTKKPVHAKIIFEDKNGKISSVTMLTNNVGNFNYLLPPNSHFSIEISSKGYFTKNDEITIPSDFAEKSLDLIFELSPIEKGEIVRLNNIFFDFNKSTLKPESFKELNKLVDFLNSNEDISIEISGHTDNIGSQDYNWTLSNDRARAVADYLASKIINSSRISYKGYGSTIPISDNAKEEGRANNRRVEFKILSK